MKFPQNNSMITGGINFWMNCRFSTMRCYKQRRPFIISNVKKQKKQWQPCYLCDLDGEVLMGITSGLHLGLN